MHRVILLSVLLAAAGLGLAAAPAVAAPSLSSNPWLACEMSMPPECEVHGGPRLVLLPLLPEVEAEAA